MGYALYIFPPEGAPQAVTTRMIADAFASVGLPGAEETDQRYHWLVLEGFESPLDLTVEDGVVTGACFRWMTRDDVSVVQRVADVFKSIGWQVADDAGMI